MKNLTLPLYITKIDVEYKFHWEGILTYTGININDSFLPLFYLVSFIFFLMCRAIILHCLSETMSNILF